MEKFKVVIHVKIGKYGRILKGDHKNWYVYIKDDAENTGGYLILLSSSLDPNDSMGFDDWVENYSDLNKYFSSWKIEWTNDR